ncbi:hypothetical protein ZIOFF_033316 [Zingiber officinale]|uniref:Pentatricopeptide repeat-containing protein n=1 Tax=Zingiber officinale TaxID=94328 RepID=A0A8J5GK46_ZINOF|nr:hypothetical protein ZIOFF_033316 [Zingiber officinale]
MKVTTAPNRPPPPPRCRLYPIATSTSPVRLTAPGPSNILFSTAAKSKPIDHALKLFHLLPLSARDTVTWNTAISICLRHRRIHTALRLFRHMLLFSPYQPDIITLRLLFRTLSHTNHFPLLPQVHAYTLKHQHRLTSSELTICTTCLLNLYRKFGRVELARQLFDAIPDKDTIAFTSMLMAYREEERYVQALRMFHEVVETGGRFMLNEHVFSCVLGACASASALFIGQQIHALVVKSGMASGVYVGACLVAFYAKCREMACAKRAFFGISEPTVVSWNALLAGKSKLLDSDGGGFQLFCRMRSSGLNPDHDTFAGVLRSCREGIGIGEVRELHGFATKMMEIKFDLFVGIALFEAYLDHGCFNEAQQVFSGLVEKDDVAYNLAIQGYTRNGQVPAAVNLFIECLKTKRELRELTLSSTLKVVGLHSGKQLHAVMIKYGCRCERLFNSLTKMYLDHHVLDDAINVLEHFDKQELTLWTSLISGLSRIGESELALKLYATMTTEEPVHQPAPNHYIFSALLSSCAHIAAVEEGKQIHAQIIKSDIRMKHELFVASSLLCMYAKSGYIEEAIRLFEETPKRDIATWNAMISALAQHGFPERAIGIFEELVNLKEPKPNNITYIAVLSACNHCGWLEVGYQYFKTIKEPTINHYACVIDMFARAGKSEEAIEFVDKMPFKGKEHIWSSLLASSCANRNIELGEYAAKKLLELNPIDPGTYIALSNLYAACGRWGDAHHVRKLMKSTSDKKHSGVSWLTVNSRRYAFTNERSHI